MHTFIKSQRIKLGSCSKQWNMKIKNKKQAQAQITIELGLQHNYKVLKVKKLLKSCSLKSSNWILVVKDS